MDSIAAGRNAATGTASGSTFHAVRSSAVTEQFEGRGRSLTVDQGWRGVAESILGRLKEKGL